ncbi:MAG: hypothetical protein JWR50_1951 [Mucilaginibacter sp.]|nr:hypothetical protein [Mucilaginibacter sp.]
MISIKRSLLIAGLFGSAFLQVNAQQNKQQVEIVATIGHGQQPQVGVNNGGTIRVAYGVDDKIFCATSFDHGQTFSTPVLVARVDGMHLGMSRGPQISSSANCSIITAINKAGNIYWFKLDNRAAKWKPMGYVNDLKNSAPEGMIAVSADKNDGFYAVWLDTRSGGKNQVCFSSLSAKTNKWAPNHLIYKSPDMHVCECCRPSIAVSGNAVAIMFRNWLNGSRDMYVMRSADHGRSFSDAQKMGLDTWKLEGCPMDGGGIRIDQSNTVQTTWQRKGDMYFTQGTDPETYIGKGKTCAIAGAGTKVFVTYRNNDTLKLVTLPGKKATTVGEGDFIKAVTLNNGQNFLVWQQDDQIRYRVL